MIYAPLPPKDLSDAEHDEARDFQGKLVVLERAPVDERGRDLCSHDPRRVWRVDGVCPSGERLRCFRVRPVADGPYLPQRWMPFGSVRLAKAPLVWCLCGRVLEGWHGRKAFQCSYCKVTHEVPS